MDKIKILVVDDKKIIGDVFDMALGQKGHKVVTVQSKPAALEALEADDFDIVFVDFVMPENDGVSVLQMFKEIVPDIPVVMMSGYTVEERKEKARELGMAGFLKKPFDLDELKQVIKIVLGKDV